MSMDYDWPISPAIAHTPCLWLKLHGNHYKNTLVYPREKNAIMQTYHQYFEIVYHLLLFMLKQISPAKYSDSPYQCGEEGKTSRENTYKNAYSGIEKPDRTLASFNQRASSKGVASGPSTLAANDVSRNFLPPLSPFRPAPHTTSMCRHAGAVWPWSPHKSETSPTHRYLHLRPLTQKALFNFQPMKISKLKSNRIY